MFCLMQLTCIFYFSAVHIQALIAICVYMYIYIKNKNKLYWIDQLKKKMEGNKTVPTHADHNQLDDPLPPSNHVYQYLLKTKVYDFKW